MPRQALQVVLPLTPPPLAALGTLEFTWLYNDIFWGAVLLNQGFVGGFTLGANKG